jgi:hypothetical protein
LTDELTTIEGFQSDEFYNWNESCQMALSAVLIIQEGVQSDVEVSIEGVRPDGTVSCIDQMIM